MDGGYPDHPVPVRAMPGLRTIACFLLSCLVWAGCAGASETEGASDTGLDEARISVGVYVSPPFVMKDDSGGYSGMAIDLWEDVAQDQGWQFDYIEHPTFGALVGSVEDGELDVAVTNLTITQDRAERIDFTHPWYDAGMRVMTLEGSGSSGAMWSAMRQSGHLRAYAFLGLVLLMSTWALTIFDRRFDKDFPKKWGDGLAESFYHVMSIATSGKAKRNNLFGSPGKVMAAVWMVCGVAVVAYITSSITSVMTTISLTRQINGVGDLPGRTIGVLEGSTAEQYAQSVHFDFRRYTGIDSATQALNDGSVIAVIADAPVLEYYVHTRPGSGAAVVGETFNRDKYGFGLQHGSGMTKPLSIQLIGMHESGRLEELRARYFGSHH